MSQPEKLKCESEAILTCALEPLKEVNPKTGKPFTIFLVVKTKSYFKTGVLEFLESHRSSGLDKHAVQMQKIARGFLARKKILGSQRARKNAVFIAQRFWRRMLAKKKAMVVVEEMKKQRAK